MNKLLIRSIILIITTGLILLLILTGRSPFGKANSSFSSVPEEEITKIELSEKRDHLVLEKKGDNWIINGKKDARKGGVLFILRILKEIRIKSPVSPELFKQEITDRNISPVKVKVFGKRRLIRSFLVYKTPSNVYGNIMKIKATTKPFIVYVPGFEGDIGSGFSVNELFWQPFTVFNLLPSEIESVRFENMSDTASSFLITHNRGIFSLSGGGKPLTGWDSAHVIRYISYFARVPFESWAFDLDDAGRKAIESRQPLYRITVSTVSGKSSTLSLWGITEGNGDREVLDKDRLIGRTDALKEFFRLRYFDVDPLIKKRSYFFQQTGENPPSAAHLPFAPSAVKGL